LVDIIVVGGESAKRLNRPGIARLLVRVDSGEVRAVIIAKPTLSVKDLCTLLGRFERRGVAGWRLFRQSPVLRVLTTPAIFVG
jgi:hypothetical protein